MRKKKLLFTVLLIAIVVIPFSIVFGNIKNIDFSKSSKISAAADETITSGVVYTNKIVPIKDVWGGDATPEFQLGPYTESKGVLRRFFMHEATKGNKHYHSYCLGRNITVPETSGQYDLIEYVYNGNFDPNDIKDREGYSLDQERIEVLQDLLASGYHYSEDHSRSISQITSNSEKQRIFAKQILIWEVMENGRSTLNEAPDRYNESNSAYNKIIQGNSTLKKYYQEALQAAREYRDKRSGTSQTAPAFGKTYTMRWDENEGKYSTGIINGLGGFNNCVTDNNAITDIRYPLTNQITIKSKTPVSGAKITCEYVVGNYGEVGTGKWKFYKFVDNSEWQNLVNGEGGARHVKSFYVTTEEAKVYINKVNASNTKINERSVFTLILNSDHSVTIPLVGNDTVSPITKSGTYILREDTPPHGYTSITETQLNIDVRAGTITSSNNKVIGTYDSNKNQFNITVVDTEKSFDIKKVNEKNEPIKGATFKIYKMNNNSAPEVKFTKSGNVFKYSESGSIVDIVDSLYSTYSIDLLPKGIYKVVETATPKPYVVTADIKDRTYYIKVVDDYDVLDCGKDSSCKNATLSRNNSITIKNYLSKIEIDKTGNGGKPLAGVKFVLLDENRNYYVQASTTDSTYYYEASVTNISFATVFVTNTAGKIVIRNLPEGTYYLKEVETVDPYVLPDGEDAYTKLVLEITDEGLKLNGKLSCVESIFNATNEFNFYKVDENGNYLSGGKFKLQKYNDDKGKYEDIKLVSVENDGTYQAEADVFKEDSNGKVQFTLSHGIATFIEMSPGTTYRIVELEAPTGFEVANVDNSAVIKIDKRGYAKGSATIVNQLKSLEGSTAQAELVIEIQTGKKVINYGLIIAGTLIIIGGLMVGLIYISKKRK